MHIWTTIIIKNIYNKEENDTKGSKYNAFALYILWKI